MLGLRRVSRLGSRLRRMNTTDAPRTDPGSIQEREYWFPYHYIPAVRGDAVKYAVAMDWAADYLNSIELVREILRQTNAKRVCDVGCGDGRLINELAQHFPAAEFNGLDVSARAVALAQLYSGTSNATFRVLDLRSAAASDLPGQDLVTLIEVIEHLPPEDCASFIKSAFDLLKPGGTLLATVPHANVPVHAKHYRHFTGGLFRQTIQSAVGAEAKIDIRFMDCVERGFDWVLSRLARNRFFCIEPAFQWRLKRRLGVRFIEETAASRVVAVVTRAA